MNAIFLSASVPVMGRGDYYETADPFLIQCAVRELLTAILGRRLLVWGGHPAITPMVWSVCEDLGVEYARSVVLYQSKYFGESYPEENKHFDNLIQVASAEDRNRSLTRLREAMLSRKDLSGCVFIGGMEGIFEEYKIFKHFHPEGDVLAVPSPGGAALQLAKELGDTHERFADVDFATLFYSKLKVAPNELRNHGHN